MQVIWGILNQAKIGSEASILDLMKPKRYKLKWAG